MPHRPRNAECVRRRSPTSAFPRPEEGSVETRRPQPFESFEVAVVRESGGDAELAAKSGNLCIEHQIAVRVGGEGDLEQVLQELQSGLDDLTARGGSSTVDERAACVTVDGASSTRLRVTACMNSAT